MIQISFITILFWVYLLDIDTVRCVLIVFPWLSSNPESRGLLWRRCPVSRETDVTESVSLQWTTGGTW